MENRLTDNEIITAMEDYRNSPIIFTKKGVISIGDIINIINRQKEEIERYKADKEEYTKDYEDLESKLKFAESNRGFEHQEITYLRKEIERLEEENKKQKLVLENINDTIHPLPFITDFDVAMSQAKSEAIKEFAERLCDGRASNDPVVIAVKAELKEMEGVETL